MSPLYDSSGRDLSNALDRHITGNWGEDQYPDPVGTCPDCGGDLWPEDDRDVCGNADCGFSRDRFSACTSGKCGSCDACVEKAERAHDERGFE